MDELFEMVAEPENKMTLMTSSELVKLSERKNLRDGKMSFKFLEEELRDVFVTFSMTLSSPFFEEFESKIQRLVEAGICPKKLNGKNVEDFLRPGKLESKVPALVLNMDDLAIGFLICSVPLVLSVVAFICELAMSGIKALAVKAKDLLTFLCLMRAVANIKV